MFQIINNQLKKSRKKTKTKILKINKHNIFKI